MSNGGGKLSGGGHGDPLKALMDIDLWIVKEDNGIPESLVRP
jgi:hypothetical protein